MARLRLGRVADGRQVVPNPDALCSMSSRGAMINDGQSPVRTAGTAQTMGDPVDLSTGQFVMEKRTSSCRTSSRSHCRGTYRTGDNGSAPFGIGSTHPLHDVPVVGTMYQEADLILPDGKRIHYVRTSGRHRLWTDAVFEHTVVARRRSISPHRLEWRRLGSDA